MSLAAAGRCEGMLHEFVQADWAAGGVVTGTRAAKARAAFGIAKTRCCRLQSGGAQVRDDGGVGDRHRRRQRAGQLDRQHLAYFGAFGDAVDTADQGIADHLGAQRIARRLTAAMNHRSDKGVQFALFGFAVVRDLHAQALGGHLDFHLMVVHEAQHVPAGFGLGTGRGAARQDFALDATIQGLVEAGKEHAQLAVQLELRSPGGRRVARRWPRPAPSRQGWPRRVRRRHAPPSSRDGRQLRWPRADLEQASGSWGESVSDMHRPALRPLEARRAGQACYFRNASRISRSSTTSSGVAGGGGGGAAPLSLLICRTMIKMMKARITKFSATVMKLP